MKNRENRQAGSQFSSMARCLELLKFLGRMVRKLKPQSETSALQLQITSSLSSEKKL